MLQYFRSLVKGDFNTIRWLQRNVRLQFGRLGHCILNPRVRLENPRCRVSSLGQGELLSNAYSWTTIERNICASGQQRLSTSWPFKR